MKDLTPLCSHGSANFARIVWADLGYGIAIGTLLPLAIFHWLA